MNKRIILFLMICFLVGNGCATSVTSYQVISGMPKQSEPLIPPIYILSGDLLIGYTIGYDKDNNSVTNTTKIGASVIGVIIGDLVLATIIESIFYRSR